MKNGLLFISKLIKVYIKLYFGMVLTESVRGLKKSLSGYYTLTLVRKPST